MRIEIVKKFQEKTSLSDFVRENNLKVSLTEGVNCLVKREFKLEIEEDKDSFGDRRFFMEARGRTIEDSVFNWIRYNVESCSMGGCDFERVKVDFYRKPVFLYVDKEFIQALEQAYENYGKETRQVEKEPSKQSSEVKKKTSFWKF